MGALVDHWPIAGLVVRTARLELRWPDDDDLLALAEVAAAGIHDPDDMPFGFPWTRAPAGELERNLLQWHWRTRGEWTPARWSWNPVVVADGEVVGTQGMGADDFALRRTVGTGSWLGRKHQGRGIGTEMRAAVLHLAFAGLGAQRAETAAWDDNAASLGVNRKLGYRPNGDQVQVVEGRARRQLAFVLTRDEWAGASVAATSGAGAGAGAGAEVEIEGLAPCLPLFGAADLLPGPPGTEFSDPVPDG